MGAPHVSSQFLQGSALSSFLILFPGYVISHWAYGGRGLLLRNAILTNSPNLLCHTMNFNCGLSDCHNMIATSFKENTLSSYVS